MERRKLVVLGIALLLCTIITIFILRSGREQNSKTQGAVEEQTNARICVAQYVSHPLLDTVYAGFADELGKLGLRPQQVEFHNANGDSNAAQILANQFCSDQCNLIYVLATPMAQSVKASCPKDKPILFGAITDPVSAGLIESMGNPRTNLTGTSDQWPYREQMNLIAEVWGKNARIGVPFNPAEANTQYAMEQTRIAAKAVGLKLLEVPVNTLGEATQAVDSLIGRVDLIYLPADNTVIAAAPAIIQASDRGDIPVVAGDPGTFEAGAVMGLGVNYRNLGVINARQALQILRGSSPANMEVQVSDRPELYLNEGKARRFSLDLDRAQKWYNNRVSEN